MRAQDGPTFEPLDRLLAEYDLQGCGTGVVGRAPSPESPLATGPVVCLSGRASLRAESRTLRPDGSVFLYNLRFEAPLAAALDPSFPAERISFDGGGLGPFVYEGPACPPLGCVRNGESFLPSGTTIERGRVTSFVVSTPGFPVQDFERITLSDAVLSFRYSLPGLEANGSFGTLTRFTLTPVPEPTTAALAAAGLLAVAAGARRRRGRRPGPGVGTAAQVTLPG